MGRLHLVPVPIDTGESPQDAAAMARRVLPDASAEAVRAARYFLVENARSARAFLKSIAHPTPLAELKIVEIGHEPDPAALAGWLAPLRGNGGATGIDAVVLSEAGCPGIADPGASVVARAHELGIEVVPWVGPSSIVLALMSSGMNGQHFRFLGYLPQDRAELAARLREVQRDAMRAETQIFIETPYRNLRLFETILQVCDARLCLCVACDLTGSHEFVSTRSIGGWRKDPQAALQSLDRRPAVFLLYGSDSQEAKPA
jgi:16S rRNA (cytidine1402-2'-O)-methyltransferase